MRVTLDSCPDCVFDISERYTIEASIARVFLFAGLDVVPHIGRRQEKLSDIEASEFFSHPPSPVTWVGLEIWGLGCEPTSQSIWMMLCVRSDGYVGDCAFSVAAAEGCVRLRSGRDPCAAVNLADRGV
ncbi:hypothetical protein EMIT0194MI4_130154 [Pseudomonas sp. IT-194MI4]